MTLERAEYLARMLRRVLPDATLEGMSPGFRVRHLSLRAIVDWILIGSKRGSNAIAK